MLMKIWKALRCQDVLYWTIPSHKVSEKGRRI